MLSEQLLQRLAPLRLQIHGYAHGGAGGVRRSRSRGSSAELSDFRDYVPGDDLRRVDWNAYARLNRLYVREYMEEKDSMVSLVLDTSASMAGRLPAMLEYTQLLACLALQSGDRVRIWPLGGEPSPLFHTRSALPRLDAWLKGLACGGSGNPAEQVHDLQGLPRGLSFVITDALTGDIASCLDFLRFRHQEVVLVQLMSPEELHPELEGPLRLIDSETGEALNLTVDADCLSRYRSALDDFFRNQRETCRQREIPCLCLDTGLPIGDQMLPMLAAAGLIS